MKVEVGCHTYAGDLGVPPSSGVPPWSGEPGASQRLETVRLGDGVASRSGLREEHRCRMLEDEGRRRQNPAPGSDAEGSGRRGARESGSRGSEWEVGVF